MLPHGGWHPGRAHCQGGAARTGGQPRAGDSWPDLPPLAHRRPPPLPNCPKTLLPFFYSKISKIIETLSQQLQSKGRELNEFREKHNIRLVGEDDPRQPPKDGTEGGKGGAAGVLVS